MSWRIRIRHRRIGGYYWAEYTPAQVFVPMALSVVALTGLSALYFWLVVP